MFIVTKYTFANKQGNCISNIKTDEDMLNEFEVVYDTTEEINEAIEMSKELADTKF